MDKYLNTKKAAEYCGYSRLCFGRIMELYRIPRYGPKRNRFNVSDLDNWMIKPELFTPQEEIDNESSVRRDFRKVI